MTGQSRRAGFFLFLIMVLFTSSASVPFRPVHQDMDPSPPDHVVKLIFIHHSTGENWLTDGYGNLGQTLGENNYFVSDTNYGWGPDAIGDRTDIPNWLEWFASDQTPTYMNALINETSQNSSYTRTLSDPGGENQIIMFKSCFPNSDLSGNPNDPASPGSDLTVGNAKYVYNEILKYFATRPDKLFVVITQPPLSDPTHAANARAFTNWLASDWLEENNYTLPNVAVFDFHNVLTAADAHHRLNNGAIERLIPASDTLYYPSGDDHPNQEGSKKATDEFIPLLNVFYNRWAASSGAAAVIPPVAEAPAQVQEQPAGQAPTSTLLDGFEDDAWQWQVYSGEMDGLLMDCQKLNGSMQLIFSIPAGGWGTCSHDFDTPQDWSSSNGISFRLQSDQAGSRMHVDLYTGTGDNRQSYVYETEIPATGSDWTTIQIKWQEFTRVAWEENAGVAFDQPDQVTGLAIGFPEVEGTTNAGTIRVDDLQLSGGQTESAPVVVEAPIEETAPITEEEAPVEAEQPEQEQPQAGNPLSRVCGGAVMLPVGLLLIFRFLRRVV